MFDLSEAQMTAIAVHHLDHDNDENGLLLADSLLHIGSEYTKELLQHYLTSPFEEKHDYYKFTYNNEDPTLNPVRICVEQVFNAPSELYETSKRLAKLLYQSSNHPNIKSGDLYVVRFDGIRHEDEMIDAIGIFKSETKDEFLKLIEDNNLFSINNDIGLALNKLDKGCIIYNTVTDEGYIMSIIDKTNRGQEAQYWRDDFLHLTPREDAYHHTAQYMNMAQTYVSHQLAEDFEVKRTDQIDLLNRSNQYFKENDSFETEKFEQGVLGSEEVIESFRKYKDNYQDELDVKLPDDYGISEQAYKKSARGFKSVLKLDKNFHVYIHGDRKLIESGTDADGRKWYKLYYADES